MSKVFNMVGGGGGPAASIFVTGLSETDAVTATKGAKTLAGKWTQKPNPECVVPTGYTQLEYIKSTGTQYIKTGFPVKSTTGYEVDFALVNSSGETGIIGGFTYGGYHHMIGSGSNQWRAYYGNGNSSQYGTTDTARHVIEQNVTAGVVKLDGVQQLSGLTFYNNTSRNVNLFCFDGGSSYPTHQIGPLVLYSAKIYDNGNLVGNLIPCKRNSDSAIGLYDIVNGVFYTNAGTGDFAAGSEIPQTIYGHMISKIRDFGTWTVTATDGTSTYTQDVLVDVITEYEIEITKKLYLYRYGDECEDITGGWSLGPTSGSATGVYAKTNNVLQLLSNYSKLYLDVSVTEGITYENGFVRFNPSGTKGFFKTVGRNTYNYDLSNYEFLSYPLRIDAGGGTAGVAGTTLITEKQYNLMKILYDVSGDNRQILIHNVWAE